MKVKPNLENYDKIGIYVWQLGRNLLQAKRMLRRLQHGDIANKYNIEFQKGIENEAHNRYYSAKAYFYKEMHTFIKKKDE